MVALDQVGVAPAVMPKNGASMVERDAVLICHFHAKRGRICLSNAILECKWDVVGT